MRQIVFPNYSLIQASTKGMMDKIVADQEKSGKSRECKTTLTVLSSSASSGIQLSTVRFFRAPLLAANPHLHSLRHLAEWASQSVGDLPKTANGRVNDPSFDPADVRPVEAAVGAEAFLREASLIAEFAHHDADGLCLQIGRLDLPLAPLHRQIRWW